MAAAIRSLSRVRLAALLLFIAVTHCAYAQDQENRLIDRLLRPDVQLQNSAQNRQFGNLDTTKRAAIDRAVNVREFTGSRETPTNNYSRTSDIAPQQFRARMFRDADSSATAAVRAAAVAQKTALTREYADVRQSGESWKANAVRQYAGSRPFLGEGKSQQALKQQDRPMSIDEVRELLNKNK